MDKKIIENNLKTKIIGRKIVCYDTIDSTQEEVKRNSSLGNGTVIIAERQTKGKETHGRVWYTDTEYKNIAKSLILFSECKISKLKEITIIIAKCIVRTFEKLYNLKLQIKEPNDIVFNSKKIGGILVESKLVGEIVKKLYIGIGINILQQNFNIENVASSILNEFNIECNREKIIAEFFKIFEKEYLKLLED